MRTADRITAIWDRVRPTFADAFHPDDYDIERMVQTPDGYGGFTEQPRIVESGTCSLDRASRGDERLRGDVMTSSGAYIVELPIDTTLTGSDALIINGRRFDVTEEPRRGGDHELFTVAAVEERQ